MSYEQIARAVVEEAIEVDAAETARHGNRRGDELAEILATDQGRRGWLRSADQRLEQQRAEHARPIPRGREERLLGGRRRLEEELAFECHANEPYEAYRANGKMKNGRRFGAPPKPLDEQPTGQADGGALRSPPSASGCC